MNPVIKFEKVWKRYLLTAGSGQIAWVALKTLLGRDVQDHNQRWALRDVSFEVRLGEALGIIGPNGAGKTTILRLLAGITAHTRGRVETRGRIGALINLGAGFQPELTGRENIYLNGVILGMSRREIAEKFDAIVEFSGLGHYLDEPVKRYSAGMYARLGFSISIHVDPDILLIDEVLSVGDTSFQARCIERMKGLRDSETTIVFVSHNLPAVQTLCSRAIYLENGTIQFEGTAREAAMAYREKIARTNLVTQKGAFMEQRATDCEAPVAQITDVSLYDANLIETDVFRLGESLRIRIDYFAREVLDDPIFGISIHKPDGTVCCSSTNRENGHLGKLHGQGTLEVYIPKLELVPDSYIFTTWLSDSDNMTNYDSRHHDTFRVETERPIDIRWGVYVLPAEWRWHHIEAIPKRIPTGINSV